MPAKPQRRRVVKIRVSQNPVWRWARVRAEKRQPVSRSELRGSGGLW